MPLQRRLPKRGFKNIFRKHFTIIHVGDLERFEKGVVVDIEALKKAGLVKGAFDGVKVLSDGEIQYPLTLKVHRYSKGAKEKIEAAGGRIEVI
jgi:large subunit ribosomal protein L15